MTPFEKLDDIKPANKYIEELKEIKGLIAECAMNRELRLEAFSNYIKTIDDLEMFIIESKEESKRTRSLLN